MDRVRVYGGRIRHLETFRVHNSATVVHETFVTLQDQLTVLDGGVVLDIIIDGELSLLLSGEHEDKLVELHAELGRNVLLNRLLCSLAGDARLN